MLLTNINTPKELLQWMDDNLEYEGKCKGWLRTPRKVIEDKKGHCWETSELTREVLTSLGFKPFVVFTDNKESTVTHTTVIYQDKNKWFWFEWAWYSQAGIHFYSSKEACLADILAKFKKQNPSLDNATISQHVRIVREHDDENTCVNRLRSHEPILPETTFKQFVHIPLNLISVSVYKSDYRNLSRIRTDPQYQGILILDPGVRTDKVVGFVCVNLDNKSIQAIEVVPSYRDNKLGQWLMTQALNKYHATNLSVNKNNTFAYNWYLKVGFKVVREDSVMYYMELPKKDNKLNLF